MTSKVVRVRMAFAEESDAHAIACGALRISLPPSRRVFVAVQDAKQNAAICDVCSADRVAVRPPRIERSC